MKVYFTILDVLKISSLGYNYAAIRKLEKNGHFYKKLKFEMEISSKKERRVTVTSFSQTWTIVKVNSTILDVFIISNLGYNYAAI